MRKRQKFVFTSFLLALGLVAIQNFPLEIKYVLIALMALATWILSAWSLRDGLSGVEWLTVPLPPTILSLGVGLFYILLPGFWLYQVAIVLVFAFCQYASLLTANIFSVAAIRTIALLRTANVVGTVMMLLSGFLLFNTILSFRPGFLAVGGLVFLVGFTLYLPALWSILLEDKLTRRVWLHSLLLGLMNGFLAMVLSFWPMNFTIESLFLVTYMYVATGIIQHHYQDKLSSRTVWEYVVWGSVVMLTALAKTFF